MITMAKPAKVIDGEQFLRQRVAAASGNKEVLLEIARERATARRPGEALLPLREVLRSHPKDGEARALRDTLYSELLDIRGTAAPGARRPR